MASVSAGPRTTAPCPATGTALPDQIIVVPYDNAWPQRFRVESQLIHMVLDDLDPVIEHIGSTSVPGLAAKPTIDMLVGVTSLSDFGGHIDRLVDYGYEYIPEYERALPDRRFFKRVVQGQRTHHVHVVQFNGFYWRRYMAFRDSLRCDPALAARYATLKRGLALRHRYDRDAYTNGKTDFVESVLARCVLRGAARGMTFPAATANCAARRQRDEDTFLPTVPAAAAGLQFRSHFGFCS